MRFYLAIVDKKYQAQNDFNFYDQDGIRLGDPEKFGATYSYRSLSTSISINYTFVAFTQVKIEVGPPFDASHTTSLNDVNFMGDVDA